MRLAVVTLVAGRHRHLRAQQVSLWRGHRRPDLVVIAAMGDPDVGSIVDRREADHLLVEVSEADQGRGLPLARARNVGAETAFAAGADLVVFLDVDCLASRTLLSGYEEAAIEHTDADLLCGPVCYLPPLRPGRAAYTDADLLAGVPHPGRPAPGPGEILPCQDMRLFWSLSFATDRATWTRIGGFNESYVGYGAEDTDLGQRAASAGVRCWWVGSAVAYHQWHPVSDPPVEHVESIVRNANIFRRRWGWFPMEGWLHAFEQRGLARRRQVSSSAWEVCSQRDAETLPKPDGKD